MLLCNTTVFFLVRFFLSKFKIKIKKIIIKNWAKYCFTSLNTHNIELIWLRHTHTHRDTKTHSLEIAVYSVTIQNSLVSLLFSSNSNGFGQSWFEIINLQHARRSLCIYTYLLMMFTIDLNYNVPFVANVFNSYYSFWFCWSNRWFWWICEMQSIKLKYFT